MLRRPRSAIVAVAGATLFSGCTPSVTVQPVPTVSTEAPALGACRVLTAADVARPSDESSTVACTESHSAETFAVGPLPARLTGAAYDDPALGRFAYRICSAAFAPFLGADESQVLRTMLTWAWFRPSTAAWAAGARWYRCDVHAGSLPTTAKGLLLRSPDRWMTCVDGPTVAGARVPCSEPHTWRAVTTIVLGTASAAYPGERVAEAQSKDYCSRSVGAWLGYPLDYDYGYTVASAGEWSVGSRRSICWARTTA